MRCACVALLTSTLGLFGTRCGEAGQWHPIGPDGGRVFTLVADRVMYAGVRNGGVFRSADADEHWRPARVGLPNFDISVLVIGPTTPGTLYAGTNFGVFKTTDEGASWRAAGEGSFAGWVGALAIDPQNPRTLYAGTSFSGQLYRTTDGAATWELRWQPPCPDPCEERPYDNAMALAVDPSEPGTVFAALEEAGILRSLDGGQTWSTVAPGRILFGGAASLAIDPRGTGRVYAAAHGMVLLSIDGGASFRPAGGGLPSDYVYALSIDRSQPATIYAGTGAGIFKSIDAGESFSFLPGSPPGVWVEALAIRGDTSEVVYAGTTDGLFKTTDAGGAFTWSSRGLSASWVTALAVDPVQPGRLYASTSYDGVLRSIDGGGTWLTSPALDDVYIHDIAVDPHEPSTVYASRFAYSGTEGGGVSKSIDGGATWRNASSGLPLDPFLGSGVTASVTQLIINPEEPSTVFAITGGVYKTVDGGETWNRATQSRFITSLAMDPASPTRLFAGGRSGEVYRTVDGGTNWLLLPQNLTEGRFSVDALAVDPRDATVVFAASGAGLFRSRDGGDSWTALDLGAPGCTAVAFAIDPRLERAVHVDTTCGVYRTFDGGDTWETMNAGLHPTSFQHVFGHLAIDPVVPGGLYKSTQGGGVFRYDPSCAEGPGPAIAVPRLVVRHLRPPSGDDWLRLQGRIPIDTGSTIDAARQGVRLVVENALGQILVDGTVPGGPGWRKMRGVSGWIYAEKAPVGPFDQVRVWHRARERDVVRFELRATHGDFASLGAGGPLRVKVWIGNPTETSAICGAALVPCAPRRSGRRIDCLNG